MLAVLALACCAAACSKSAPPSATSRDLNQVPERYRFLEGVAVFDEPSEEQLAALPFTRISFERTGCYGTCPVYRVDFHRDGRAELEGREHAPHPGEWQGTLGAHGFGLMSLLLERMPLSVLRDSYAAPWTDDETVVLEVELADGSVRSVRDYGRQSPPELQALFALIESHVDRIDWAPRARSR